MNEPTRQKQGQTAAGRSRKASPLTQPLPTGRIAFAKQLALLRAYAAMYAQTGVPVSNEEVAKTIEMSPATVQLSNAFFVGAGFLERQNGGFVPQAQVIGFHKASQWNPDTAGHELATAINNTWFGAALMPKLSVQGSMTERQALTELSKASNATPEYGAQLRMLLDYMEAAGLIVREGDMVRQAARQPFSIIEIPDYPAPPPPAPTTGRQDLHPFVEGLLQELPEPGQVWSKKAQDDWIEGWRVAFKFLYKTGADSAEARPAASDDVGGDKD